MDKEKEFDQDLLMKAILLHTFGIFRVCLLSFMANLRTGLTMDILGRISGCWEKKIDDELCRAQIMV